MNNPVDDEIRRRFNTLWIVWGAILASLAIYVIICQVLEDVIKPEATSFYFLPMLRNIFYILTVLQLLLSFFLRKIMLSGKKNIPPYGGPAAGDGANISQAAAKYFTAVVVALALSESIGIFGLVLFMLGDSLQNFYFFIIVSGLAVLYHRPKTEEFEERLPGKPLDL